MRSIVGRFLEHSRVFYFENGGDPEMFCASADWMERNFFRRVEVAFPIRHPITARAHPARPGAVPEDNCQAWELQPDGSYERFERGKAQPFNAQAELLARYAGRPAVV